MIGALEAMPGVRDDDVDPAEGKRRRSRKASIDRRLAVTSAATATRGLADRGGDRLGALARSMSVTTTHAPAAAKACAAALPMPPAPPVISTTAPSNSPGGGASESLYSSSGQNSIPKDSSSSSETKPPRPAAPRITAIARW